MDERTDERTNGGQSMGPTSKVGGSNNGTSITVEDQKYRDVPGVQEKTPVSKHNQQ